MPTITATDSCRSGRLQASARVNVGHSPAGEAELVCRDVEAHYLVAGIHDRLGAQASAAGKINAGLAVAGAQSLLDEASSSLGGPKAEKVSSYQSALPS